MVHLHGQVGRHRDRAAGCGLDAARRFRLAPWRHPPAARGALSACRDGAWALRPRRAGAHRRRTQPDHRLGHDPAAWTGDVRHFASRRGSDHRRRCGTRRCGALRDARRGWAGNCTSRARPLPTGQRVLRRRRHGSRADRDGDARAQLGGRDGTDAPGRGADSDRRGSDWHDDAGAGRGVGRRAPHRVAAGRLPDVDRHPAHRSRHRAPAAGGGARTRRRPAGHRLHAARREHHGRWRIPGHDAVGSGPRARPPRRARVQGGLRGADSQRAVALRRARGDLFRARRAARRAGGADAAGGCGTVDRRRAERPGKRRGDVDGGAARSGDQERRIRQLPQDGHAAARLHAAVEGAAADAGGGAHGSAAARTAQRRRAGAGAAAARRHPDGRIAARAGATRQRGAAHRQADAPVLLEPPRSDQRAVPRLRRWPLLRRLSEHRPGRGRPAGGGGVLAGGCAVLQLAVAQGRLNTLLPRGVRRRGGLRRRRPGLPPAHRGRVGLGCARCCAGGRSAFRLGRQAAAAGASRQLRRSLGGAPGGAGDPRLQRQLHRQRAGGHVSGQRQGHPRHRRQRGGVDPRLLPDSRRRRGDRSARP